MDKIGFPSDELEVFTEQADADDMLLIAKRNGNVGMTAVKNVGGSSESGKGNSTTSATAPTNPAEGDHWISTITYIDYTRVSGAWIEL